MDKAAQLQHLYQKLEKDAPKLPLAQSAQDIVPGEGPSGAEVFFIGEAPGYFESVQRRPFVGKSGQLLRKTLTENGIEPSTVYIGNIVKVRPPDNRDPSPAEIAAYKPYLDQEIEIIQPLLIVTLGRFSMAKFLPDVKVSQVHGRLHRVKWQDRTVFVLPFYHPAAALRSTQVKNSFVADCQKIPKIVEWLRNHQAELVFEDDVKDALL